MTYLQQHLETPTPQNEALDGQVPNSGGGFSFPVNDQTRLRRFLILGSEGGSYYAGQRELTKENIKVIKEYIAADPTLAIQEIVNISEQGRAPRNSEALFCLAVAASSDDQATRQQALYVLPKVARTGSHLHEFVNYVTSMRRWGRGLRRAVGNWYINQPIERLIYQAAKYRTRNGWSHRDLLRMAHPEATSGELNKVLRWITHGEAPAVEPNTVQLFQMIYAYEKAQTVTDPKEMVQLIHRHRLPREFIPTEMLKHKEVWQALGQYMPATALLRNLATLTINGAIAPMESDWATEKIKNMFQDKRDEDDDPKMHIDHDLLSSTYGEPLFKRPAPHPLSVLQTLMIYRSGQSPERKDDKGKVIGKPRTWKPVAPVIDALDHAFTASFNHAAPTNKRLYIGIDVSASMGWNFINGIPKMSAAMGAGALGLTIARTEPNYYMAAFSACDIKYSNRSYGGMYVESYTPKMAPIQLVASDSIQETMTRIGEQTAGPTDCSMPMMDALGQKIPVDCFIIITDNETNTGKIHPAEALRKYRKEMGIPAKLAVFAMTSNGFSIADPNDGGMLDLVGFDAAMPSLLQDFITE